MTPSDIRLITVRRLDEWRDQCVCDHTTPALMISVGHDLVEGTVGLHVARDMSREQVVALLVRMMVWAELNMPQ